MNNIYRTEDIDYNLRIAKFRPLDVLVIGGTGAGKSSTLNSLFEREVAEVGEACDPKTMNVSSVKLNELMRFWDTPGLGDSVYNDLRYSEELINILYKTYSKDGQSYGYIDVVLVILDGAMRDLGTTYKLLNDVIVPNFQKDRILVAINQADMAMKGRHWNELYNKPDDVLKDFLEQKAISVQERIKEATGINIIKPIYYSAQKQYNITTLLDMIIDNMPRQRRNLKG